MNDHPIPGINNTMQIDKPMNIPGNPTETDPTLSSERRSDPELKRLEDEVIEYNEAIKKQKHIRWLASVEITRIEKSLGATLKAIETITKGPES